MLYLAGQILVFVLVAMLLGAGLAWFFLLGPVRRPAVARAAPGEVRPGEVRPGEVRPGDAGRGGDAGSGGRADSADRGAGRVDDVPGRVDEVPDIAVPGVLPADLAARLRQQEDAWARERAELTARLDAAERQAAESELRVAAAERQVGEAERRVAEIEFQLREVEEGVLPGVGKSDAVAVAAGGPDAAGRAEQAEQEDSVTGLARETIRLEEALADAEGRAAKVSARLAVARTEAEDAERSARAMALRLDRHQAEWAAEKAQLTAMIPDGGTEVGSGRPAPPRDSPTSGGPGCHGTGGRPAFVQEDEVYGVPAAVAALSGDDLKEIVGIGQAVEARLHTLGITSFRQIALMGDADVDRLARKLGGFGDRIVFDDWVGQARELQAKYHGGLA